jgi:isochorismate pyruvate lyase|tara:strand:+ start:105 stop:383 length:279 start_codon:yes stop_codon:yes gene_type:complete
MKHNNMKDLRVELNQIDSSLLLLFKERFALIHEASLIKKNTNEIRDYERIEQVIEGVRTQSKELGLNQNSMEYLWRFLIELSIKYEIDHFDD